MSEIIASTYEIIEKIGAGGGGIVYLANHLRLGKKVVLKADKRKITTRPELLRREVDILKDLSHPHIPQVYDFFVENGTVYTAIDYIEGESLDVPLKRGEKFPQPQVIKWAGQLLEALCYLHSPTHGTPPRGYVHSDIKPANLMRTPGNDVFLIDFNIALALGEENVIGCSAGYASPEHYGLDFSSEEETVTTGRSRFSLYGKPRRQPYEQRAEHASLSRNDAGINRRKTDMADSEATMTQTCPVNADERTATEAGSQADSDLSKGKTVVPDIRSDIYSLGATLYHLLSGTRPARNAKDVVPLSEKECSPQIAAIISKAMNPNPNLRYQTAEEMLYAFRRLHENDPRMRRRKRNRRIICSLMAVFFTAGAAASFIGLKRMQTTESWLKLVEYSGNALLEGDTDAAVSYALQALPLKRGILEPKPASEAQRALTAALGVYDLSDGYKAHGAAELASAPLCMEISPDGKTACCICACYAVVFDTDTMERIAELPAEESALSEVRFLNNSTIIYAGSSGITAYDFEKGKTLWTGAPATAISVSGDGKKAAAVYKEEAAAVIYDTSDGRVLDTVDFNGRHQRITTNDIFANPGDNIFALNDDGTCLSVSFSDGSLQIFHIGNPEKNIQIFEEASGYTHFEGGFYDKYFAFSASDSMSSVFAVIDTENVSQTGGFETEGYFSVQTDENGIYLKSDNLLVKIHPETGEQTPLVTTSETILHFAVSSTHTLIASEKEVQIYDANAMLTAHYEAEQASHFVQIAGGTALIGSSDSPAIRILKYENHPEAELLSYDASYQHDEARISGDGESIMLFSWQQFRVYDSCGELTAEVSMPNASQIYDQQFIRDETGSRLEVTYYDGRILAYDAADGALLYEKKGEEPDTTLYEEFFTDKLRIESPLHGTPAAYDRKTGRLVRELDKEAYLTYVTQAGDDIVVQYITADGYCYGQLLNESCEALADLPYLCDVAGETLIFDYPTGNLRKARIYDIRELVELGQE